MSGIKVGSHLFDDDLFLKSEKLKLNHKTVQTPLKSFTLNDLRGDVNINEDVKLSNEIFKRFTKDSLSDYVSGVKDAGKIHLDINRNIRKTSSNELNFCFTTLNYTKFPEGKEIDLLTNLSYIYSDATPLPLIHNFFNRNTDIPKAFEEFTKFMGQCIDSINRLNNKAILGVIPSSLPAYYVQRLMEFYHDNNITSFAFDFENKTHSRLIGHLREMMISIINLDILDESFTYSCNTQRGRASKSSDVIKARDILVYNLGFDIVGNNHMPLRIPSTESEKLKNSINIRLFNNDDYGHHKYDNINDLSESYPYSKTSIPIDFLNPENNLKRSKDCQKLFNNEMFGLELLKYRELLKENESALDYLNGKNQIKDDLNVLKEFNSLMKL